MTSQRPIYLKGELVSLGQLMKADLHKIWLMFSDFKVRHYGHLNWKIFFYEDEEQWYEEIRRNKDRRIAFAIMKNEDSHVIGIISISVDWVNHIGEIGYWIGVEYWGKGYVSEAVKLILEYAFKYLNLVKVYAHVVSGNKASARVLEKNGFKLVGKYRKHLHIPNEGYKDVLVYDLLREEYITNQS